MELNINKEYLNHLKFADDSRLISELSGKVKIMLNNQLLLYNTSSDMKKWNLEVHQIARKEIQSHTEINGKRNARNNCKS